MKRFLVLLFFALLIIAAAMIVANSLRATNEDAYTPIIEQVDDEFTILPDESGVFERAKYAIDYENIPLDIPGERTLSDYYKTQAYHGAPPYIPHPISNDRTIGEGTCLQCHQNGGYVAIYDAYAPVTPHPEKVNCRQCHVGKETNSLFKESTYPGLKAPKTGTKFTVTAPPVIPHQLQLHENCLACHAGPAAPKEIRVTHPERVNCRQCHVVNNQEVVPVPDFTRKTEY
ncbi:cytochrome C [Aureivirga sp. CE67]|uniref:cytochrome C n=1 Tax=Aureivirga sp. CE67 TaxID=1788983 RepID=UPI0018CB9779|nr:cytochrome C [Aureivirga sp. CE67]